jgi:hypothetical protein
VVDSAATERKFYPIDRAAWSTASPPPGGSGVPGFPVAEGLLLRRRVILPGLSAGDVVRDMAREGAQLVGKLLPLLLAQLLLAAEQVAGDGRQVLHHRDRVGRGLLPFDGLLNVLEQLRGKLDVRHACILLDEWCRRHSNHPRGEGDRNNPRKYRSNPRIEQHGVSMEEGFVYLETSPSHPGIVRLQVSRTPGGPPLPTAGSKPDPVVRLVVKFTDVDAGMMHAHNALRRRLIDVDARTYRTSLEESVAAVEGVELPQQRVYLDPQLEPAQTAAIAERTRRQHALHARQDRVWQIVGGLGVGFLVLLMLTNV